MSKKPISASWHRSIRLRPARVSDARFAETLYLETMLPLLARLGQGDADALKARFARGYSRARSRIVCAAAIDAGWMQVSRDATGLHLDQLHLLPDCRGRGIGSLLLDRLLHWAGRIDADVRLDVIHGNPAIALYRRFGFVAAEIDQEKTKMVWRAPRP